MNYFAGLKLFRIFALAFESGSGKTGKALQQMHITSWLFLSECMDALLEDRGRKKLTV